METENNPFIGKIGDLEKALGKTIDVLFPDKESCEYRTHRGVYVEGPKESYNIHTLITAVYARGDLSVRRIRGSDILSVAENGRRIIVSNKSSGLLNDPSYMTSRDENYEKYKTAFIKGVSEKNTND